MANKFGAARPPALPVPAQDQNDYHASRVHFEMYRAIEALGRKLERAEDERTRLTQRLALIELSTERDPVTGKVYLPARLDVASLPSAPVPRWHTVTTVMSCALAILALLVVVLNRQPQDLTPQQIAAINKMMSLQLAQLERAPAAQAWRRVDEDTAEAEEIPVTPHVSIVRTPRAPTPPVAAVIAEPGAIGPFAAAPSLVEERVAEVKAVPPSDGVVTIPGEDVAAAASKKASPAKIAPAPEKAEVAKPSADQGRLATADIAIQSDTRLPARLKDLETRAFNGVAEAQHDLATIYASGQGVKKDYKRAAYWFFQAADAGIANAHYNLGVMFQQGLGVTKDFQKSLRWYESAARLGHPEAMYNLGIAYVEGVNGVRDLDRGVAYFKRAANAGVAQAAFNLGVLYESGFVGPIDRDGALDWYRVAANNGHAEAADAVTRLEAQMKIAGRGAAPKAPAAEDLDSAEPAAGEAYGEGDASQAGDERKVNN